jgi:hypothetical protein
MKFQGIVKDGKILYSQEQLRSRKTFVASLEGKAISEDIEIRRQHRSDKQLKVIFGLMMSEIIVQANDLGIDVSYLLRYLIDDMPKGQAITKDFLHELMYVLVPTVDDEGRRVTLSKMDTLQASRLFEGVRNILAPIGINVPDPDINWKNNT